MIKRFLKEIISIFVITLVVSAVNAVSAEDFFEIPVDVTVNTVKLELKTTEFKDVYTLKVFSATWNEATEEYIAGMVPIYLGESIGYEKNQETGTYTYEFETFSFPTTASTGNYVAIIGNKYKKVFNFVNSNDKIDLYKNLEKASASEIYALLDGAIQNNVISFDMGNYFEYSLNIRKSIDKCLAVLQLPILDSVNANVTPEDLVEYENIFKTELSRLLNFAEVITTSNGETMLAKAKSIALDTEYIDSKKITAEHVMSMFNREAELDFSADESNKIFDTAVLRAIINNSDYGTVISALEHYNGKIITLDKRYSASFTETQANTLGSEIKMNAALCDTCENIERIYLSCSEKVKNSLNSYVPSTGGGGGSIGGGISVRPSMPSATKPDETVKANAFQDVSSSHWAAVAIESLKEKGIIHGVDGKNFEPDAYITREAYVKMLVDAFSLSSDNAQIDFNDVAKDKWSYEYIRIAANLGIVSGTDNKKFSPESNISRQDMAVISHRLLEKMGYFLKTGNVNFSDKHNIADYAMDAIGVLSASKILNGMGDGTFCPLNYVTRAQASMVVFSMLNMEGN